MTLRSGGNPASPPLGIEDPYGKEPKEGITKEGAHKLAKAIAGDSIPEDMYPWDLVLPKERALSKYKILRIRVLGPQMARVRGVRVLATPDASQLRLGTAPAEAKDGIREGREGGPYDVVGAAIHVFRKLTARVFEGFFMPGASETSGPDRPSLLRSLSRSSSDLSERLAGIVASDSASGSKKLADLQRRLFSSLRSALQEETARLVADAKKGNTEADSVFLFELLSMLAALASSPAGAKLLAKNEVLGCALSLLPLVSPRVARLVSCRSYAHFA